MAKGASQDDGNTREKLLAIARSMFYELGYAKTSMDELCAAAGLTRGALYHHFGGKSGLLEALILKIHDEIGKRLCEASVEDDPWVGFRACTRRYLEMAMEPEIQRIVFQDAPAVLGQRMSNIDRQAVEPIKQALEELMKSGRIQKTDGEALARLLNGATREAALWLANSEAPPETFERVIDALDVLFSGLETS